MAEAGMQIAQEIKDLAAKYRDTLKTVIRKRVVEMEGDDTSHFLVYRVLGVSAKEGREIDVFQNKGRFLYKYAGSFLEEAARRCFHYSHPESGPVRIPNSSGSRPKTFEIDCLVGNDALEIKWRDATTDGDHITKEHTRLEVIAAAGFTPVRVMFYYPNRTQAMRIQQTLATLYAGKGGHYHFGQGAWDYVRERTGVDLLSLLKGIADEVGT